MAIATLAPSIVRETDLLMADALGAESFEQGLRNIAEQARLMIGAHQAALSYLPDRDFSRAVHAISLSDKYEHYRTYDVMPTGAGIWTLVAEHRMSFCMTQQELVRHSSWRNFSGLTDARGSEHPPMRGWLAVPVLTGRGDVIGIMQLSDKVEGDFRQDDLELLTRLSKLVAPTMELQLVNSELHELTTSLSDQRGEALKLAKRAQEARTRARRAEERLNLALKSANAGTWIWDVLENTVFWDDYIHPLFGLAPGTFHGRFEDVLTMVHPEDQELLRSEVNRNLEEGGTHMSEFRVVWPDGSVHALGARGKVYRDGASRPVRMTGVCWDNTERRRADEALRESRAELARSNADLEQFAYAASHDLQEPLRAVTGYGQLLAERYADRLDDQAQMYIHHIVEGGSRMQALIEGLLEYSRVGSRGKQLDWVDAEQVLAAALANLHAAIAETGAHIEHGPLPCIRADRDQLVRLFQNLISNAIKYRGAAPPRIEIAAQDQGRDWRFSVRDHGIGFDPRHSRRIFMIFQRLHTRREYPGTGIGLAVCERIVERHGGRIWAESSPGQGSTFYFTWPHQGEYPA